jgi:predicted amidophosphoribosyltransferase
MALTNCSECGKEISTKASSCPHCGNPGSSKSKPVEQAELNATAVKSDSQRLWGYLSYIAAGTVVALAFVMNPTPLMHSAKIKEAMAVRSPLASILGAGQLAAFATTYHSLGLGSYTEIDRKVVSVGLYGVVIVLN